MATKLGQGNFINGSFLNSGSITLTSENPSCNFQSVFSVKTDLDHVPRAIEAARSAYKSWSYTTFEEKRRHLLSLKAEFIKNESLMAEAISEEMGKIKSEAQTESKSLSARIDLMLEHGIKRVKTENLYDLRAETRAHAQGVLAILGPYNFPAHLMNAHVIPSLMMGNTVVIKPSEVCPWVGEVYASCLKGSSLPQGVANLIHGAGDIGKALCSHPDIDGVLFTGSYSTGRHLKEMLLDQPQKILALEMGGKNFAVVMDDADLEQALSEVINGAFLTAGQRCTATSRLLVHEKVYHRFKNALVSAVKDLKPCAATEPGMFGPLATKTALKKFMGALEVAKNEGAEVLVESVELGGGAFVTPSIYEVKSSHPMKNYLGEELFGPNLCLESFANIDEAIHRINQSPYGLSNAIFTFDKDNQERLFFECKSGILNINRSTNNAYGQMPFGGVNKSGNQRPAGIDAVRYASFPVAVTNLAYGESGSFKKPELKDETPISIITLRHQIEKCFELYGIYSDNAALDRISFSQASFSFPHKDRFFAELSELFQGALKKERLQLIIDLSKLDENIIQKLENLLGDYASLSGLSLKAQKSLGINVPPNLSIPRSRAMLDRLYKKGFVPAEKKSSVIDLSRTRGAFLVSVDDDPLVLFDAASQIATLGTGFLADAYQNAYDNNEFDWAILKNSDLSLESHDEYQQEAELAKKSFEDFLHKKSGSRFYISYGSSGAEANEIALDLCRTNGHQKGTRILAFEGAFHGRTIMTLQATYNKEKRGPFALSGYEATFLPFPENKDPDFEPSMPENFLAELKKGQIPAIADADDLLKSELLSLASVKEEVLRGNICAIIIEPMQCEGGDRYATNRFFSGLRALSRGLNIPLILDEVQTGFNLGRKFFWHQQLKLQDERGEPDYPDCVTLAKKAQLGVCLSIWKNPRPSTPHVIQLKRGLIHGQSISEEQALKAEKKAKKELLMLKEYFPDLIFSPRACGFAFAFDMATKELATTLVDQRFHHGFMVYIAGEKTLRFRLNTVADDDIVNRLFEKLFMALADLRDGVQNNRQISAPAEKPLVSYKMHNLDQHNFSKYKDQIEKIENSTYEPGRRDSMDYLLDWLKQKDSLGVFATKDGDEILGYAISGPLEHSGVDGPTTDHHNNLYDSLYSANITVAEKARGLGLGRALKYELIKQANLLKNPDGSKRYLFMSSRNRVGKTAAMNQINEELGAYLVKIYDRQYDNSGQSAYLRLPLQKNRHVVAKLPERSSLDCRNSLQSPFHNVPESFLADLSSNKLRSILGSKLTLSNWSTPNVVRYSELLRCMIPKHLNHAYFTSGRDEVVDKGLRSLRFHRPDADIAIGFSHQWLGNITAASRTLSFNEGQAEPFAFFNWPKVTHPALNDDSIGEVEKLIHQHGAEKILGLVVELLGEKSSLSFSEKHLDKLDALRKKTGVPLVFVESTSFCRSGQSLFLSDHLKVKADMVWWYTGGQLGHVFTNDKYYVAKPLTLISTWDGDELSIARSYHNLHYGHYLNTSGIKSFEESMLKISGIFGQGCVFGLKFNDTEKLEKAITLGQQRGVLFGRGFDKTMMIMAKPDFNGEQFEQVLKAVKEIVGTK